MKKIQVPNTQAVLDGENLCKDPETEGFDLQAGQSWVYPTNYPLRDYQFSIIQESLHQNTLVSLPTGLGKTFIAAVVMYNYYRWYPHGKIIFMAPTKPLVKQQIDACYNIMAIPKEVTAELTGMTSKDSRKDIWKEKRVFFVTPQVLQNDLSVIDELGPKIKCLVFDEAHKAKGNFAYCGIVNRLSAQTKNFRVLALSATPGNSVKDILEVVSNLQICHLEFRTDESPDVKPYTFQRSLETVVVGLGDKLQQIRDEYIQVLEKYTRNLIKYNVIQGNYANLTKGKIFMTMQNFQQRNSGNRLPHYGEVMKTLNICVTLYHAFEVLVQHGLRGFLNFFTEHISKPLLRGNTSIIQIMEDVREYLGPEPNVEPLPDGSYAEIPKNTNFGHPKYYKLRDILRSHFENGTNSDSRVIVFFEYRESVMEAYALLLQERPTVRPKIFLGQSSGITQKVQINVIKAFRQGDCNTLLSTCIGEEGLDVGEVDLIVCFDISKKSPIRMIQRMGRTGRKREGRIIVLVTEGREQDTLKNCLIYKNNLESFVFGSQVLKDGMCLDNPKMIPSYIKPKCQKIYITVPKLPVSSKNSTLDRFLRTNSGKKLAFLSDDVDENMDTVERLKATHMLFDKVNPLNNEDGHVNVRFSGSLEKQRVLQRTGLIAHSKSSADLVALLQFADSKRYNIPVTQYSSALGVHGNLKQGDIRTMFTNPFTYGTQIQASQTSAANEKSDSKRFPTELFSEISSFLSIEASKEEHCKVCSNLFDCIIHKSRTRNMVNSNEWMVPDITILDSITADDVVMFSKSPHPVSKKINNILAQSVEIDDTFDQVKFTQLICEEHVSGSQGDPNLSNVVRKSFSYEVPKNFASIVSSYITLRDVQYDTKKGSQLHVFSDTSAINERYTNQNNANVTRMGRNCDTEAKPFSFEVPNSFRKTLSDSPDLRKHTNLSPNYKESSRDQGFSITDPRKSDGAVNNYDTLLLFFKLSCIEDLFAVNQSDSAFNKSGTTLSNTIDSSILSGRFDFDQTIVNESKMFAENNCNSYVSPDIFETSDFDIIAETPSKNVANKEAVKGPESPILCTSERAQIIKRNARRQLFEKDKSSITKRTSSSPSKINLKNLKVYGSLTRENPNRSAAGTFSEHFNEKAVIDSKLKSPSQVVGDFCDLSFFGLSSPQPQIQSHSSEMQHFNDKANTLKLFNDITIKNKTEYVEKLSGDYSPSLKNCSVQDIAPKVDSDRVSDNILDLIDVCDITSFLNESLDLNAERESSQDKTNIQTADLLDEKTKVATPSKDPQVIDLTDSDFELSPLKDRFLKPVNKLPTQMTITQALNVINKSQTQKENSTKMLNISTTQIDSKTNTASPVRKFNKSVLSLKRNRDGNLSTTNAAKEVVKKSSPRALFTSLLNESNNSDDDFEESPILRRPAAVSKFKKDFNKDKLSACAGPSGMPKPKSKRILSEFIEHEADVSLDENVTISDDEDSGEDAFEASFVEDENEYIPNTQMQVQYMKSVRSPVMRGIFKIPDKPKHNYTNIFSQEIIDQDDTYMNDSFCVDTQDIDCTQQHEMSELELLEEKLNEIKRDHSKEDQKTNKQETKGGERIKREQIKRRRIITVNDSSDSD